MYIDELNTVGSMYSIVTIYTSCIHQNTTYFLEYLSTLLQPGREELDDALGSHIINIIFSGKDKCTMLKQTAEKV